MAQLFETLPSFAVPLPQAELQLLVTLPWYGEDERVAEINPCDEPLARRLERRGLIKIQRQKMDPVAIRPTWFAGRIV